MIDEGHGVEIDASDCTVFTVAHLGLRDHFNFEDHKHSIEVLDDSLLAISEVVLWERAHDQAGKASPFQRRVGRVDVKFFSIDGEAASEVMWLNPLYRTDHSTISIASQFLSNMVMTNGPAANPLPTDAKRIMSSVDLVNLGFFTEAFVAAFALLDDLVQRVVAGGLSRKGLSEREQQQFLRAIKEERLNTYLNRLTKVCDWVSLEETAPDLNREILKVNTTRNDVMHGDRELTRSEALSAIGKIAAVIDFLRANPFGVSVIELPPLRSAEPHLSRMPDQPDAR